MKRESFNVGDEVVVVHMSYLGRSHSSKITKVHKNGNFKVEGRSEQFRPSGFATGTGYSNPRIIHADSEEAAKTLFRQSIKDALSDIEYHRNSIAKKSKVIDEDLLSDLKIASALLWDIRKKLEAKAEQRELS